MPAGVGACRRTAGVRVVATPFGSSGLVLLLAGVYCLVMPQTAAAVLLSSGSLSALFLGWAAYNPEELSLARNPPYQDQRTTGCCRTAAAEIPVQFPGHDRAIERLESRVGPGTQMAVYCVRHL